MLIVAIVSLVVAMASYSEAIRASEAADHSAEIANESLNTLIKVSKASDDLVKWYQVPHPIMSYSYNVNYINGRVNIEILPINGFPSKGFAGSSSILPIKITIYNSGRAPLMASKFFINLTSNNINDTFPFKIYKIITPLEKMYYDSDSRKLVRSYETETISTDEDEFPPHVINGEIYYRKIDAFFAADLDTYPKKGLKIVSAYTYRLINQKDQFGPFEIGTIDPDKKAEIEIWLFAIAEGEGNLSLIVDSEDLKSSINYNYNNNISIDIPLRAVSY